MRYVTLPLLFACVAVGSCSKSPPAATAVAGTNTTISGTVVERTDGSPYSYLRVRTESGEKVWVAVPIATIENGRHITIRHGTALKNFQAPRLGRTFDLVVFGTME